jgi:hypothetical protein
VGKDIDAETKAEIERHFNFFWRWDRIAAILEK